MRAGTADIGALRVRHRLNELRIRTVFLFPLTYDNGILIELPLFTADILPCKTFDYSHNSRYDFQRNNEKKKNRTRERVTLNLNIGIFFFYD